MLSQVNVKSGGFHSEKLDKAAVNRMSKTVSTGTSKYKQYLFLSKIVGNQNNTQTSVNLATTP